MTLYLPYYPISAIETGQNISGGGRVWDVAITQPARGRYIQRQVHDNPPSAELRD